MRKIAILLNIGLIGFVIYNLAESGMPSSDELFVVSLIATTPVVSIWALITHPKETKNGWFGKTWIGLLLERKRLEEESRIKSIRSSSDA